MVHESYWEKYLQGNLPKKRINFMMLKKADKCIPL